MGGQLKVAGLVALWERRALANFFVSMVHKPDLLFADPYVVFDEPLVAKYFIASFIHDDCVAVY